MVMPIRGGGKKKKRGRKKKATLTQEQMLNMQKQPQQQNNMNMNTAQYNHYHAKTPSMMAHGFYPPPQPIYQQPAYFEFFTIKKVWKS